MTDREIKEAKEKLATIKAAFGEKPAHTVGDVREAMLALTEVLDSLLTAQQQANTARHGSTR